MSTRTNDTIDITFGYSKAEDEGPRVAILLSLPDDVAVVVSVRRGNVETRYERREGGGGSLLTNCANFAAARITTDKATSFKPSCRAKKKP